jgi:hypothetical protein
MKLYFHTPIRLRGVVSGHKDKYTFTVFTGIFPFNYAEEWLKILALLARHPVKISENGRYSQDTSSGM